MHANLPFVPYILNEQLMIFWINFTSISYVGNTFVADMKFSVKLKISSDFMCR